MPSTFDAQIADAFQFETISVSFAALLIAWELGQWEGRDLPESELRPYLKEDPVRDGAGAPVGMVVQRVHTWQRTEPTGLLKVARDALQAAIIDSIEKGRLRATLERRDLNGKVVASNTLLLTDEVLSWCETHGIELGDFFNEYVDDERNIVEAAIGASAAARLRLTDPDLRAPEEDMGAHFLELLAENRRLKERHSPPLEAPLTMKERNTLLAIIGLLAKKGGYPLDMPRKCGELIASEAALEGFRTLSPGAVAKHIKAAAEAMEARKR